MKGLIAAFDEMNGAGVAALIRDGKLDDLLVDVPDDRIRPGAIFRAKATRLMKGQGGMVLQTPQGPVFLRNAKGVSQGQTLIVQATTHAEPGKATPATSRVVFKSRYCLVTPGAPGLNISKDIHDEERRVELRALCDGLLGDGFGMVLRSAAADGSEDAVLADVEAMISLAAQVMSDGAEGAPDHLLDGPDAAELAFREWPEPDLTDADAGSFERQGVMDAIEAIKDTRVDLEGGAYMFVEPTRAMVAVDVNTGADTSPAAGLKANIAALKELPRALRLRGLGGQITLDLAPTPKKDRRQIEQSFRAAFRRDRIETSLAGWTPLGNLELQRKRERLPVLERLS